MATATTPPVRGKSGTTLSSLQHLTEHLGAERFAVAGFSMGALIAQAFASLQPRRLTHLGLLHSVYQRTEARCRGVRERYRATRDRGPHGGG